MSKSLVSRRARTSRSTLQSCTRGALASACAATLLAACGGGGGGSNAQALSQGQIESDAANGSLLGSDSAGTFDNLMDTTQLAAAAAGQTGATTDTVVNCAGGGTATISITGGTAASQLNGQFDAGEHYAVQFAQCRGQFEAAQLDGAMEMDITSATSSASTTTVHAALTLQGLAVTLPLGSLTLTGPANLSRTVAAGDNGATTTTSELTSSDLGVATTFHQRTGQFDFTGVDMTRTVNAVNGAVTGSTLAGQDTITGTVAGYHFTVQVSTDTPTVFDANGTPVSGAWTALHGESTIHVTLASGQVTITLDRGSDGTIDRTWSFSVPHLLDAEG